MDAATLARAMPGLDTSKAEDVLPDLLAAMARGEITTLRRAQYFLAQVGHESVSLRYFEEIASGAAYEGRSDLGNTQPGDGRRFKGRGPIQLTGRANYTNFGRWLGDGDLFVRRPELVARYDYGFLATVFYWSTPHGPRQAPLNVYCDASDFEGMTRRLGGGLNGYADRQQRLRTIEQLGDAVLPSLATPTPAERSAVRRLHALRARANRPPEKGGGWGSASDPTSRKSRAARTKLLIKGLMRRIRIGGGRDRVRQASPPRALPLPADLHDRLMTSSSQRGVGAMSCPAGIATWAPPGDLPVSAATPETARASG